MKISDLIHRAHHFVFGLVFKLGFAIAPECLKHQYNMALQIGLDILDRIESDEFVDMLGPDFNPGNED